VSEGRLTENWETFNTLSAAPVYEDPDPQVSDAAGCCVALAPVEETSVCCVEQQAEPAAAKRGCCT
jgi:hypothetical protein